jgi:hypothetical protein
LAHRDEEGLHHWYECLVVEHHDVADDAWGDYNLSHNLLEEILVVMSINAFE